MAEMKVEEAVIYHLAKKHLSHLLPPTLLESLKNEFEAAETCISKDNGPLSRWSQKIDQLHWGGALSIPKPKEEVIRKVKEALLSGNKIWATHPKWKKRVLVNPLALVYRNHIPYLVCSVYNFNNVLHLAIHRMSNIDIISDSATDASGYYTLEEYNGGEEFAVIIEKNKDKANKVAERIREEIEKVKIPGISQNVTISIGVATYPDDMPKSNSNNVAIRFIEKADEALYQAKERGRNKVCYWNSGEILSCP